MFANPEKRRLGGRIVAYFARMLSLSRGTNTPHLNPLPQGERQGAHLRQGYRVNLLCEDASAVVKTMADETKAKLPAPQGDSFAKPTARKKHAILPNEPTDFEMKNRGYPAGR